MKKLLYITLCPTLLLLSCKKELKQAPATTPVFTASGTLGTQAIQLGAGNGDTVMTSYQWNWNNVAVQTGILGNATNYVKIELFSGDIDLPTIDQGYLSMTQVAGAYIPTTFYALTKAELSNAASIQSIAWNLGGSTQNNDLTVFEPGKYTLGANVQYASSAEQVSNDVFVGYHSHQQFKLSTSVQAGSLTAHITAAEALDSVQWVIGATHFTTVDTLLNVPITDTSSVIQAIVFFKNGIHRSRTLVFDRNQTNSYLEDYVYKIEKALASRELDYKTRMEIMLNGVVYKTQGIENQPSDMINIAKKEQYIDPISGKKALKLSGNVHGTFLNTSTGESVEGSFSIEMAFTLPE